MKRTDPSLRLSWLARVYLWLTELLYYPLAWAYDAVAWLVSFGFWSRWRRDALAYLVPGPILETGFGTGSLLIHLAQAGYDVVGLELSRPMHRMTSRKCHRKGIFVPRIQCRTEAIAFQSRRFMNILVTFPSNYITRRETLGEFHRILKPGGRVVLVGMGVRFRSKCRRWLTDWFLDGHSETFIAAFSKLVEDAGFSMEHVAHQTQDYVLSVLILEHGDAR